jgi:hypothetical protein
MLEIDKPTFHQQLDKALGQAVAAYNSTAPVKMAYIWSGAMGKLEIGKVDCRVCVEPFGEPEITGINAHIEIATSDGCRIKFAHFTPIDDQFELWELTSDNTIEPQQFNGLDECSRTIVGMLGKLQN